MSVSGPTATTALLTILRMAVRQSANRLRHLQQRQRSPGIAYTVALFGSTMMTLMAAFGVLIASESGGAADAARSGAMVVSTYMAESAADYAAAVAKASRVRANAVLAKDPISAQQMIDDAATEVSDARSNLDDWIVSEARRQAQQRGGTQSDWQARLTAAVDAEPPLTLVSEKDPMSGTRGATFFRLLAIGGLMWWLALVLQGDGMVMDISRRRHPLWEWYLTFPVRQPVVYLAEALRPLVSNPFMVASPILMVMFAGWVNSSFWVGMTAIVVTVPFMLSAAVTTKLIEVLVMLRVTPRNRSAWLVMAGGLGFLMMMLPLLSHSMPSARWSLARWLAGPGDFMPSAAWLVQYAGVGEWLRAVSLSLLINLTVCALALLGMHLATLRGFEAGFGPADQSVATTGVAGAATAASRWQRWPLLRKELLWLRRDRGALVQMVFVPLMLVGLQFLNFGQLLRNVEFHWHQWTGVVVGAGAYMIGVSAPRMLAAEGPALGWMLSWPRSLLDVARTKALVLASFVSLMVVPGLIAIAWMNPPDAWKIGLIGLLWFPAAVTNALKAVTVFPTFSAAGEQMPMQASRNMAAGVGNMVFAVGIYSANWPFVCAGLLMNAVFATALWSRLTTHIAYLLDPDSEPAQVPPTMISALVAIVAHLEIVAVLSAILAGLAGMSAPALALLWASTISAALVTFYVWRWNRGHGVGFFDIVMPFRANVPVWLWSSGALLAGAALGGLALAYLALLHRYGSAELVKQLDDARVMLAGGEGLLAFAIVAIVIAPMTEEFLFRGLLFRAMERQWSFLPAALLSAAFFAAMHPALSWPPVCLLGFVSAWLFARAGNLLPSLILHASYNAVVLLARALMD